MKNKAQAQIIVTVLIILIVLAAVALVGRFIYGIVKSNANFDISEISLSIDSMSYNSEANDLYITIQRNSGKGNFSKIRFTRNLGGSSDFCESSIIMDELEKKVYVIKGSLLPDSVKISLSFKIFRPGL